MNAMEIKNHCLNGGVAMIPTNERAILLTGKLFKAYDAVGQELLRDEGNGFRMRQGKRSIFVFGYQIKLGSPLIKRY
jgi:hypothetical protein